LVIPGFSSFTSTFQMVKTFLPKMIEQNHGHIVNMASMSAFTAVSFIADYRWVVGKCPSLVTVRSPVQTITRFPFVMV
jgi:hypothetical protein